MAQITSMVMTVFMLVPAVAPSIGQQIGAAWGWRSIFLVFVGFALVTGLWLNLRLTETLPPARRRPFTPTRLAQGLAEVLRNRTVMVHVLVLTLGFAQMFALLTSTPQIYDEVFGKRESFPLWFMLTAVISVGGTITNGQLVMRLGMRRIALWAYRVQAIYSGVMVILWASGLIPPALQFPLYFIWTVSVFSMAGLTFGNLNALALQPVGHLAGLAASLIAAVSTIGSVILALPVSLSFNGTPLPVMIGMLVFSTLCFLILGRTREAPVPPRPH